ncbi:5' nucleotidase, NT5C type [Bacillus massiliigorillae]|uniref:5' nucleotidase, NT5C type n=1 Tax=Bacillus massiliigorillae TaxID=1243664 RepID=UPI0003A8A702|nr:hypothetical protein [Bacillus massiliigorillae]
MQQQSNIPQTKPIILVDIDDTLNVFSKVYWAIHNQAFEDNVHPDNVNQWDLDLFSNRGLEAYQLFKIPGLFRHIPVKEHAQTFIEDLQDIGEVYMVSDVPRGTSYGEIVEFQNINYPIQHAHSNPADDKRAWIKEHFPNFPKENVIFCSCKWMIYGDILIDDKPNTFIEFQKRGRDVILIDMLYNRHIDTKWRARDLQEAKEMVVELLAAKENVICNL